MPLFGAIQQSSAALKVTELGLQVTGNNVANANTPGYIRQELLQETAFGVRQGSVVLGYGVRATAVVQKVDEFLLERMRSTSSELARSDVITDALKQLEGVFSELTSNDISTKLSEFSNAFQDLANQPGNDSLRSLVLERGKSLVDDIQEVNRRVDDLAITYDTEVKTIAGEINRLSESIANLNVKIVGLEGGDLIASDAVGMRDERIKLLEQLAELIDIRVSEQESGASTILVGGDYLVTDGISRPVAALPTTDPEDPFFEVRFIDTDKAIEPRGGRLAGIYDTRTTVTGKITADLDGFAQEVIKQVNQAHSQGQGTRGFREVVSSNVVSDSATVLENAGLPITVDHGRFQIQTIDSVTGQRKTYDIPVNQDGLGTDSSLTSVATTINNVPGITASVTAERKLKITADAPTTSFSFQNDTSNFLAAIGINTFFVGNDAESIEVNPVLLNDQSLLATSLDGVGRGTRNAVEISKLINSPNQDLGGRSIREIYEAMTISATQYSTSEQTKNDGLRNFYSGLEAQHLGISGVNLDEEAVKLILYQRAFQASSKVISTANEMLQTLINL